MKFATLVLTALLLLVALDAGATQIVYRSPQDLGRESALVVDGTVTGVRSFWNPSHTAIMTETMVEVRNTYKGNKTSAVRLVQPGGVVGHVRTTVAGALSWQVGEPVVLFLEPGVDGAYQVAGFSQGKFLIERDPDSGREFVRAPDAGGATVLGAPSAGGGGAKVEKTSVETFINRALGRR